MARFYYIELLKYVIFDLFVIEVKRLLGLDVILFVVVLMMSVVCVRLSCVARVASKNF